MSTITLPNIRVGSDLQVRVRLKDGGVAIDWSTLSNIKACIYSDAQRALAGRCAFSIDEEDNTLLVCTYAANKPQYLGVNRIVISAKYMGETKTYDKPAFSFVRWTADQEGEEITIDDPNVDVEISVEDISSSILQEAVDAAFTAADRANEAAAAAEHMVDIHTGPKGDKGDTGETPDISIGTVTTVEPGEPAAASMSGTPEAPVLNLSIPKGLVGYTPNITVGTVTTGEPGTPVVVTLTGTAEAPVLNITIPQGMQGNTGSSVEYPFELVNNLTTDDATKALSAAQGVALDNKVSQLRHEVTGDISQLEAKMGGIALYPVNKGTANTRDANGNTITNTNVSFVEGHTYEVDINFPSAVTFGSADSFKLMTPSSTSNYKTLVAVSGKTYAAGKHTFIVDWQGENTVIDYRVGFYTVTNIVNGTTIEIRDKGFFESALLPEKVGQWENKQIFPVTNWVGGAVDTNLDYQADARRNIGTMNLDGFGGRQFYFNSASGYGVNIRFTSAEQFADPKDINLSASDILYQTGWVESGKLTIPVGTKSAVILERHTDNSNIDLLETDNVSFAVDGFTMASAIRKMEDELDGVDENVVLPVYNFVNGSLDPNLSYIAATNRLIGTLDLEGMVWQRFLFSVGSGYKLSLRFISHTQFVNAAEIAITNAEVIYKPDGWLDSGEETIPSGVKSIIIIAKKSDESDISVSDASNLAFGISYDNLDKRIDAIESRTITKVPETADGMYSGELVALGSKHPYNRELWKTIGLSLYAQSMAIYGDYIVFFYGDGTSTGSLWKLSDATKLADITFGYGTFSKPHGNVMNFGDEFASGNTDLPLLYVSQWDGNGGCLVYDIHLDGTCNLVQSIMVSDMNPDVYGSYLGDWVLDTVSNSIYSVKYHNSSTAPSNTNYDHICRYKLPKLSDGTNIVFTNADITDSFIAPFTPISQDKKIWKGLMFIAAGNTSYSGSQKIFVIDINRKAMVSVFNLAQYGDEPEGLDVLDDGLILGYGYDKTNFYIITT